MLLFLSLGCVASEADRTAPTDSDATSGACIFSTSPGIRSFDPGLIISWGAYGGDVDGSLIHAYYLGMDAVRARQALCEHTLISDDITGYFGIEPSQVPGTTEATIPADALQDVETVVVEVYAEAVAIGVGVGGQIVTLDPSADDREVRLEDFMPGGDDDAGS